MTVVSDTSPLSALASIHRIDLLREIFGKITVPERVLRECLHPRAPDPLRHLALCLPEWVLVENTSENVPPEFAHLDPGETAALMIARACPKPVLLLIDERKGAKVAEKLLIPFVGTLGILVKGHQLGLLDFEGVLAKLRNNRFFLGEAAILRARSMIADSMGP